VNEIEPHWAWLIIATVLAIAELIVPGVFLIWLSAAAALTGIAALLFDLPVAFQFVVFALFSLASVYFGRRWYHAHPVESSDPLLNDRAARLIGETVVVVGAIENGRGRVAVGDTVWPARGADAAAGTKVRVVGADGTCLKVEPLAITAPQADEDDGA
jgi:membrane protein implicated in regulation of membrane protease activity